MVALEVILAALTFIALIFITAPYGRHHKPGRWGPVIPARLGWILMESPAVVVFAAIFAMGDHSAGLAPLVLLCMWQWHYIHRTFIFPFRMRSEGKTMPVLVAALAVCFNVLNAYVNARWISHFGVYQSDWLYDPRFILGALVFFVGFGVNVHADNVLFNLRAPGETGYKIPRGGVYRWVTAPNYLGEVLEWCGWALASWSLGGLAFAIYTAANLVPRALSHHRWYRETFEDYPAQRRAIFPFVL